MTKTDDAERLPTRVAALAVLVDARGPAALPDLVAAVDHQDPEYRKAALLFAEKLRAPAAVRQWTAKADKVDAERRAEIILMLGRQGDKASAAYIRAALAAKEPVVAMAAAESLAHMERGAANAGSAGAARSDRPATRRGRSATSCCGRPTRRGSSRSPPRSTRCRRRPRPPPSA